VDPSDVHPDLFGEALSQSGQRLAQLGSLLTSWAMVQARRTEQRNTALAARNEQDLRELRDQERAARELARAGWAPAHDRHWLASRRTSRRLPRVGGRTRTWRGGAGGVAGPRTHIIT
jgi:hypothetical protein